MNLHDLQYYNIWIVFNQATKQNRATSWVKAGCISKKIICTDHQGWKNDDGFVIPVITGMEGVAFLWLEDIQHAEEIISFARKSRIME